MLSSWLCLGRAPIKPIREHNCILCALARSNRQKEKWKTAIYGLSNKPYISIYLNKLMSGICAAATVWATRLCCNTSSTSYKQNAEKSTFIIDPQYVIVSYRDSCVGLMLLNFFFVQYLFINQQVIKFY